MDKYYSLGEVARLLGVAPHRIVYLHTVGKSPEPQRIFGNRAYCWSQVVAMAKQFGVALATSEPAGDVDDRTG
jgi:DNA-binding transcriptional MerR regulator